MEFLGKQLRVVVDPHCPPDTAYFLDPEAAEQRGAEIVVATDEIARRLERNPEEIRQMVVRIDNLTPPKDGE